MNNTIGDRLANTRKNLNFTQKEFAEILGISQGALSGMEQNKRGLPMEVIIKLIEYSKENPSVDYQYILIGEPEDPLFKEFNSLDWDNILTTDEDELVKNYRKLDNRGKHKLHTVIYEELDRMGAALRSSASEKIG